MVKLPVTVFEPIELPGAQVPPTVTVFPVALIVPIPPIFCEEVKVGVIAVTFKTAPEEPAVPTVMLLLESEAPEFTVTVPPLIFKSPVEVLAPVKVNEPVPLLVIEKFPPTAPKVNKVLAPVLRVELPVSVVAPKVIPPVPVDALEPRAVVRV